MAQTVDTSMYNNIQNPLTNLGQTINTAKDITAQNLLNQELQGRTGMAQLYANAPRDASGQIDANFLTQNAGRAGIMAPEVAKGAVDLSRVQQQLTQEKLKTAIDTNNYAASGLLSVLNDPSIFDKNGNLINESGLNKSLAHISAGTVAVSGGSYSPQQAANDWADVINSNNPRQAMMQHLATAQARSGQFKDAYHTLYAQNPALEANQTVKDTDPNSPTYGQDVLNAKPAPAQPQFGNGQAPAQDQQPNQGGGQPQGSQQPSPREASFVPPTAGQQPQNNGKIATSMPPNFGPELEAGRDEANAFIAQGNNAIKLEPSLKQVMQLADAGGPNQEKFNKISGVLKDTPLGQLFDVDTKPQVKFELLNKFASDVSGQNMSSNARNQLESSVQALSNPNSSQFPGALRAVSKFLLARTEEAKAHADYLTPVAANAKSPADYLNAQQAWRDHYDQNLFEMPYMNEDEKRNLIGSMSDSEYAKFKKNRDFMIKNKALDPEDFK